MIAEAGAAPASPHDCVDGLIDVMSRLMHDYGLRIAWEPLGETAGTLNGPGRLITINSDMPITDQLWQLMQMWSYLTIGPSATPDAVVKPHLQIVPAQRS